MTIGDNMIVVLQKTDKAGRLRYYTIHDRQGNLFSPHVLTCRWGLALNAGREKEYTFSSEQEKDKKVRELMKKRFRSQYKVLYGFSRKAEERVFFQHQAVG